MPAELVSRMTTDLPASATAPRHARRLVRSVLELADYPDLRFAAGLLASELTANSVRHLGGGGSLTFSLECDEETVHIEVIDDGRGFDPLSLLAQHFRREQHFHGLYLLDALADRWGYRNGRGSSVWFEIDLVPGRRPWRGREPIV